MYERATQKEIEKNAVNSLYKFIFTASIIQAYLSVLGALWILAHSNTVALRFKEYHAIKNKYRLFALGVLFNWLPSALVVELLNYKLDDLWWLVLLAPMPFAVFYAKWNLKMIRLADGN